MAKVINGIKTYKPRALKYPARVKRDLKAWEALAGIWKGKKLPNVLRWQKNIRKEWERKLPVPK